MYGDRPYLHYPREIALVETNFHQQLSKLIADKKFYV